MWSDLRIVIMWLIDWLIDYLLFYVPIKNFSLIWRRHHCLWRAAKLRPMLGAQGLWAGRDLYRATPAVTRTLVFPVLSEGPPHLVASYDTLGDAEDLFLPGSSRGCNACHSHIITLLIDIKNFLLSLLFCWLYFILVNLKMQETRWRFCQSCTHFMSL
jgi:hypothetical protein